jgi:CRP/FNR family cyclic AMP-dependent transcriptional regulator
MSAEHVRLKADCNLFRGTLCEALARRPARRVRAGVFLYLMGEAARSIYLVRSGLVKTSVISPGGQELTLRVYRPGDILGELCLCTGERRDQAVALEASEVVEIPLELLIGQLRRDPQAALDFASAACEHLAEAYERLRSLSTDPVLERLARTLLELATGFGEPTPHGTRITHYITQEELARMIGARREVVSGLLNRLRERGVISYTRRGLIIVSRESLEAFLHSIEPA